MPETKKFTELYKQFDPKSLEIHDTSEENLLKIAKYHWHRFCYLEDKSLITKKIIDAIVIDNWDFYHTALEGVNPEYISKKRALEMLVYDREVYGLLTKELQEDPDILEATTFNINKLPESLFDNKVGVNYVLDKWNKKGKSWAYGELEIKEQHLPPVFSKQKEI